MAANAPTTRPTWASAREVLKLAWPLVLTNSAWTLQIVLDRVLLSQSSTEAVGAGMAAVMIDAARTRGQALTAEQIRSAVVNTADEGVLTSSVDGTTVVTDVNITGTGRADLAQAVAARVAVGPVSTSFGTVPGGSGQTRTATVTLSSLTGTAVTVTPSVDSVVGTGVTFSVSGTPVTVPATGSVTVQVAMTVERGAATGDHSAILRLGTGGAEVAHAVLYGYVS